LLTFLKVAVLALDEEALLQHLPAVVEGLVVWCAEKKQRFKLKVKLLFEILMRKVGVEAVRELVPPEHTALLDHIRKCKEREKRQKHEQWKAHRKEKDGGEDDPAAGQRKLQDYDSIMRDDELAAEDAAAAGGAEPRKGASAKQSRSAKKDSASASSLWIRDERNVDFLDPSVVSKVTATNPAGDVAAAAAARRAQAAGGVQMGHGVVQDPSSGKLIVAGGKKEALTGAAASAMLDVEELSQELKGRAREKRKRQQEMEEEGAEDREEAKRANKKQVQQVSSGFTAPGAQFRSAKAGGDMQRRGQMSPYAFVPLEPSALNKRRGKGSSSNKRLESIVNAAKSGSNSGSAMHKRSHANKSHKKHGR
jgi:ribosomal RNA-processing protein 12